MASTLSMVAEERDVLKVRVSRGRRPPGVASEQRQIPAHHLDQPEYRLVVAPGEQLVQLFIET